MGDGLAKRCVTNPQVARMAFCYQMWDFVEGTMLCCVSQSSSATATVTLSSSGSGWEAGRRTAGAYCPSSSADDDEDALSHRIADALVLLRTPCSGW